MAQIEDSKRISGVQIVHLQSYRDERGRFMESFRKEWFPQRTWDIIQCNRSDSKKGVIRGLHYHHHQVDYWYVPAGNMRVCLADIRPSSPTYLNSEMIDISEENELGLFIPIGVAHGFAALSDVTLIYIVDNYFNGGKDENGVAWNDKVFNLDWGIEEPIISKRDLENPFLEQLSAENLPR
jgi:dTDP-4-dehydrorhamnose 3,5-epimerase